MKADITRDTFHPERHYRRVLQQQGRVQLDADFNEQAAILLHTLRETTRDLLGPSAVPCNPDGSPTDGFVITLTDGPELAIGPGRMYVDGILVENPAPATYARQPHLPTPPDLGPGVWLVYLDVWERYISWIEDPTVREVARGGVDTAGRTQVVWQARAIPFDITREDLYRHAAEVLADVDNSTAQLAAGASAYRGAENHLYRVEIHAGGALDTATFKWSRDNGSVAFPVVRVSGSVIEVADLGSDDARTLNPGDWVEVVDDTYVLDGLCEPLLQVRDVDRVALTVVLGGAPAPGRGARPEDHPLLRRWDGTGSASTASGWYELEDGVEVKFSPPSASVCSGDWWLIPARPATGNIEWSTDPSTGEPQVRPPSGITHHRVPLAMVELDADKSSDPPGYADLRRVMRELTRPV